MTVFDATDFDDHEEVRFICDRAAGLQAIIAIHRSGEMGLAGGGCRMQPYASPDEAQRDALRLSLAMSYKLALFELPVGGAKAIVIADPQKDKTEKLLRALGKAVDQMKGRFVIGEDAGTNAEDMGIIEQETSYVTKHVNVQDTFVPTAYGTCIAMREAVRKRLRRQELAGIRVAIQGVGSVGFELCKRLASEGAKLVVADTNARAVERISSETGATSVPPDGIHKQEVDVFSPCALGAVINERTVPELQCAVVCGSANDQLEKSDYGEALAARDILFVPDVVANAGGIIGGASTATEQTLATVEKQITKVLRLVFERADRDGTSTQTAAERIAREALGSPATDE